MTTTEVLQYGQRMLICDDGSRKPSPQIEIRLKQSGDAWIWAINISMHEFGYGYDISNPRCLDKAVETRREAMRRARDEVLRWLEGHKTDESLKAWLYSLCEQQLDLFTEIEPI